MKKLKEESPFDRGSQEARAVTKGLKQKELHDFIEKPLSYGAIILAIILGFAFHSFWVGLIVLIALAIPIWKWYYKE